MTAIPACGAQLGDEEKDRVWDRIVAAIPNYAIHKSRTERSIKVYRMNEVS